MSNACHAAASLKLFVVSADATLPLTTRAERCEVDVLAVEHCRR
jgi:hypothetical protein